MPTPLPKTVRAHLPFPTKDKSHATWVSMLGFLCALPAFSGDLYLSALPTIAGEFQTTDTAVQLTIATTMLGAACGQALVGPLSDRYGRKRPLLIGLFVHCILSLLCAWATNVYQLMAFRFIQGATNATANVIAMAINRDLFTGRYLSKMLSRIVLVIGVAPMIAPSIGSIVIMYSSWRFVFVLLAIIGAINWVICWFWLPDTHPRSQRIKQINLLHIFRLWKRILSDLRFLSFAINNGVVSVIMMSWVMSAPFIAENDWGFTQLAFGLTFAVTGIGMICGSQINAYMVTRIAPQKILRVAQPLQWFLILVMTITSYFISEAVVLLPILFLVFATSNPISANANSLALHDKGDLAGTASGLLGMMMTVLPAIFSPIVGYLGNTFSVLSTVMLIFASLSSITLIFGAKVYSSKEGIRD
ncbi:MAG: multidrug effflux MFS transporter [Bifidobacteriaceae bacterium]|jgi:DHA1 family bicyclomycin/chloramphenicol resistance-like MFS transporter|nr:multidrug effflux MFS transporter [Bifidobacteriaceae bacterium]